MRDRIHIKYSGLGKRWLVMQRGNVLFATSYRGLANLVAGMFTVKATN